MPLNKGQILELYTAIQSYDYPIQLFDFERNQPTRYETMRELENELRNGLLSSDPTRVKYALANVVFWGNIRQGYVMDRVNKFLANVTEAKIQKTMGCIYESF